MGFPGSVYDSSPAGLVSDRALETAAPAIVLTVFDSDYAFAAAADCVGAGGAA